MLQMTGAFVEESGYDITFDRDFVEATFLIAMDNPEACLIVDEVDDGELTGGAYMETGKMWTKENWGFIQGFMIEPTSRGGRSARRLVEELVAFSKDAKLSHVFTSSTAMVSDEMTQQFVNLFKKFGFKEAGPILVLEL